MRINSKGGEVGVNDNYCMIYLYLEPVLRDQPHYILI